MKIPFIKKKKESKIAETAKTVAAFCGLSWLHGFFSEGGKIVMQVVAGELFDFVPVNSSDEYEEESDDTEDNSNFIDSFNEIAEHLGKLKTNDDDELDIPARPKNIETTNMITDDGQKINIVVPKKKE